MRSQRLAGAVCLGVVAQAILAQQPAIPVRRLGPVVATSAEPVSPGSSIRAFDDGRVLVNDPSLKRILLFDSTLRHATVVADTTSRTENAYGRGLMGLVRFTGDSSLVRDQTTGALLVIDPTGRIVRILSSSSPSERLASDGFRNARGFDQADHILFQAPPPIFLSMLPREFEGDTLMFGPDSIAVLREDVITRRIDTIAMLQAPRTRQAVSRRGNGGSGRSAFNPIPSGDDWALLNDGTLAIVRVHDYHIDWVRPDGRMTSGPKIPTEWVRLTDSMKVAIMDSIRRTNSTPLRFAGGAAAGTRPLIEPADLPDFRPPFAAGQTLADMDGNLWVRVAEDVHSPSNAVYDVINRSGERVDRVQFPVGSRLLGFGPGVVYLQSGAGGPGQLARIRIR